jgi:hypothetical protein
MHLRMCTWSSGWAVFYAISVNYLRYFHGLYIYSIYAKKNRTTFYGLRLTWEVSCWTGSLTDALGEVDLVHGYGRT